MITIDIDGEPDMSEIEVLTTALHAFRSVALNGHPTPIQRLHRLEQAIGAVGLGVELHVKRDDLGEVGGGGNKLRKLEFLLGAALENGADTILTVGGLQSNHARLAAAACARLGLDCELFLGDLVPRHDIDYRRNGNVLLDALFGAAVQVVPAGSSALERATERAAELRAQGRKPFVIPTGGSTPLGALGYAKGALEIARQEQALGIRFDHIVVPNGSSGTHAGLSAGFHVLGRGAGLVRSYNVLVDQTATRQRTVELVTEALGMLGQPVDPTQVEANVEGGHLGDGYGIPTDEMIATLKLMATTEGLLLDPVYTGKAFAGLLSDVRAGRFEPGARLLFVMTGGAPGLFAYRTAFDPFQA
ncbi:D-cysteine desulfhydrase family protein [Cupriavidus sp. PET2-C1]